MSIISDITNQFSSLAGGNDYILTAYPATSTNSSVQINIYGVFENNVQQQNSVAVKPLEQSNFTTDSVQIKPYVITVRGIILPPQPNLVPDYQTLSDYITGQIQVIRNYANSTQLFTLFNTFSFGLYQPLKLFAVNYFANQDVTIPEVTLILMQVQSTTAINYSTTGSGQSNTQPMNQPNIQG